MKFLLVFLVRRLGIPLELFTPFVGAGDCDSLAGFFIEIGAAEFVGTANSHFGLLLDFFDPFSDFFFGGIFSGGEVDQGFSDTTFFVVD